MIDEGQQGAQQRTYPVLFDCGHHALFLNPSPMLNDIVFCSQCYQYRLVKAKSAFSSPDVQGVREWRA